MDKDDFSIFNLENMRSLKRYETRHIIWPPISQKDIDRVNMMREKAKQAREIENKRKELNKLWGDN